jgi:hypothetical protein
MWTRAMVGWVAVRMQNCLHLLAQTASPLRHYVDDSRAAWSPLSVIPPGVRGRGGLAAKVASGRAALLPRSP